MFGWTTKKDTFDPSSFKSMHSLVAKHPRIQAHLPAALLLSLLLQACGPGPTTPATTPATERLDAGTVLEARIERLPETIEWSGRVRSRACTSIAPRIAGTYSAVHFREGDPVKAGDLLLEIHAPEWTSRLATAETVHAQAKADWTRFERLGPEAVSAADRDAARARLDAAESAMDEARTMLGYTRITAPFTGVIAARTVEVGSPALPGASAALMENPDELEVEVAIPASIATGLAKGSGIRVSIGDWTGDLEISELPPLTDPATRTRLVRAPLPAGRIVPPPAPGDFVRARLQGAPVDKLLVPAAAVHRRGQVEWVRIRTAGGDQTRWIRSGRELDGRIEILSGLSGGEQVVVPTQPEGAPRP